MKKKRALAASRDLDNLCLREDLPANNSITFHSGGTDSDEMLRINPDGFYVRGVKVPQDDKEALIVYNAFREFLVYSALTRSYQ